MDLQAYFITNMEPIKFWEFMSQLLEGLGYERYCILLFYLGSYLVRSFLHDGEEKDKSRFQFFKCFYISCLVDLDSNFL